MIVCSKARHFLAGVLWLYGWWSLWRLVCGHCVPYLLALAMAAHVRFPAPLGQVLPLPDPLVLFAWSWSLPLTILGSVVACLFAWYNLHNLLCLDLLWWGCVAVASALTCFRRYKSAYRVRAAFEELGVSHIGFPPPPQQPLVTYLHAYCYYLFSHLGGSTSAQKVRITTHTSPTCPSTFDVWLRESAPTASLPVLVYVHGGGWRGGHARAHPQAPMLQFLATQGWFVMCVEYRKNRWPQHLDDCVAALRWACGEEAAALGANRAKLFLAGASAGGHIASLLAIQSFRENLCPFGIRAMVLFYPALDPGDVTKATVTLPFGRSLIASFFELLVLRGESSLWTSAQPLVDLLEDRALAQAWPPTLIVHGGEDSVVPVAHSRRLLLIVAAALGSAAPPAEACRPKDALVVVPGGRHAFELAPTYTSWAALGGAAAWLENRRDE